MDVGLSKGLGPFLRSFCGIVEQNMRQSRRRVTDKTLKPRKPLDIGVRLYIIQDLTENGMLKEMLKHSVTCSSRKPLSSLDG